MLAFKAAIKNLKKHSSLRVQTIRHSHEGGGSGGGCKPIPQACGVCRRYVYMDPKCKIALVTGGTSGIGFAAAQELLCNGLDRVVITDMDANKGKSAVDSLNAQFGKNRACFLTLDTYEENNFYECLKTVLKIFGNVDIMVNTPGIPRNKSWQEEINAHILSTIRGTMIGTEIMSKQKLRPGGVIINVASAFAFDNYPSAPVFVSENNGIIGFSKSWGATPNYTNTKVRCVVICPAAIDGIDLRNSLGISAGEPGKDSQNTSSTRSTSTSVGRGIVYCVQHASSGTVWFVEGTGLFKAHIPDRLEYSQKIRYV